MAVRHVVGGVVHLQRNEDVRAEVILEPLAGNRLDQPADDIGRGAVVPAGAGIEQQRSAERVHLAGARLQVAPDLAGEGIGQSRRVGQEMPDGRLAGGRTEPVIAGRSVEVFNDFHSCEFRKIVFRGVIERQAALLDQLHQGHRGDRLGHRGDAKQRVRRQRTPARNVGDAEGGLIQHALTVGDQCDHAGHVPAIDRAAQICVERCGLRRRSSVRRIAQRRAPSVCREVHSNHLPIHRGLALTPAPRRHPSTGRPSSLNDRFCAAAMPTARR